MSSSELAISVRDISKVYTISHAPRHATFRDVVMDRLRHPMKKIKREDFWALRDVSFDVRQGEAVGIIGRNGAGKSTLLKVLSRITHPTKGQIDLYGRVGSLLEVGTGFHPELTGQENIYMNGAILGMRRKEIDKQFDSIVDFAGVENFLDTPVKRYSSGMYVRLAFAVAAHVNPEILVIDEVLAVGDADFQRKCLGKMKDVASGGRTVLFVSHNMAALRRLCTRAILLDHGRVVATGPTDDVIAQYLQVKRTRPDYGACIGPHGIELIDASIRDVRSGWRTETILFNHDYDLELSIRAHKPLRDGGIVIRVMDEMGTLISSICAVEEGLGTIDFSGTHHVAFRLPKVQLFPGRFYVSVFIYRPNDAVKYLEVDDALAFEVQPAIVGDATAAYTQQHGVTRIGGGARELDLPNGFDDELPATPDAIEVTR